MLRPKKSKKKLVAINLQHVTKEYPLQHEKPTLAEQLFRRKYAERFIALSNVSLKIYQGERVGIVGQNGSGKTTLLKVINGISTPLTGKIKTRGKIISLIDLNAGFHPELTGEENVYLNGLVVGMSRQEVKDKFQQIVDFADIGKFIDAPFYTYSSGMMLRLGFSIAINANPDILLVDEGIAAGDQNFQKKAYQVMQQLYKKKKTILMVSHWLYYLKMNCTRFIWMDDGKIYKDGNSKVLDEYEKNLT